MLMRSWLPALCAAVCVLALAGCGNECVDQFDCRSKKGNPPEGKQWLCTDDNKCEPQDKPAPVGCSPDCATGDFCDTSGNEPVCRTCTATQGCTSPLFCDTAANNGKGICLACQDTVTGNGTDQGCSASAPICDAAAGNGAGVCRACADTATGNGTDSGCSAAAPVCDTSAGNGAGVCKGCLDSATGNDIDSGCSAATPVCDTSGGSGAGVCKACQDTATGNDTDLGCTAAAPVCNTSAASGAGACRACVDSATGNGTDLGCSDAEPICNATAANGVGACKACVNSDAADGTDLGCSATTPFCDATASNGSGQCRACTDSATGNGTDQGCSASSPLCAPSANGGLGACRICVDSATGGSTDLGCSASTPLCDATAASGAGVCKVCMNTASSGNPDNGCSAPTSFCDDTAASGLGACKICLPGNNEGCAGSQTCNAAGTQCEGCASNSECGPATPVCRPPPPVSACVECVASADCSATRPTCDTATNLCGCTDDATCASAPGNTDHCDTTANNGRGECKQCLTDAHCSSADPSHPYCNTQTATCIQCVSNLDCSLSQMCDASGACVAPPGADPAGTSAQIQQFIDAPVGAITPPLTIENAFVTYIKPTLGTDVAGFFLQAQPDGPAMFVAVDATTLNLQVGDRITLTVGEVAKLSGDLEAAATISNVTIVARGYPVQNLNTATPPGLAVDRSGASDLQSGLATYESELIRLSGTLASNSSSSGGGHVAFTFTTTGIPAPVNTLLLRVPSTLADSLDMVQTCQFTLNAGPMWRFTSGANTNAQPSAYYASDLSISNCPAPKVIRARAPSATQVRVTFDRRLDAATVQASDFTIATLTVTDAVVDNYQVMLTTSAQTAGQSYTVSVDGEVKDLLGKPVDPTAKTATFTGFTPPPTGPALVINEIDVDNVGTDAAEFVEIYNRGGQPASLADVVLLFVNGDSTSTPRKEYLRFPLTAVTDANGTAVTSLPPGGYIVAASAAYMASTPPPAGALRLIISAGGTNPGQNIIQNGADGVGLLDSANGTLLDAVFYRGSASNNGKGTVFDIDTNVGTKSLDFLEGSIALARDQAVGSDSIVRFPNGSDTNNNDYDFAYSAVATPGAANP